MAKKVNEDTIWSYQQSTMTPSQKGFARWTQYQKASDAEVAILRMLTNHELACIYDRIWNAMIYNQEEFVWQRGRIVADAESVGVDALRRLDKEAKRRGL